MKRRRPRRRRPFRPTPPIEELMDLLATLREHVDDDDFEPVIEVKLLAGECEKLAAALRRRLKEVSDGT